MAKLPRCVVVLTPWELSRLLQDNPLIFQAALKRGKALARAEKARQRQGKLLKRQLPPDDGPGCA